MARQLRVQYAKDHKVTHRPLYESCIVQATALVGHMRHKAKIELQTQWKRFGDIAEGLLWENNRAANAPGGGESASDYDKGYGLKCEGWTDLMGDVFQEIETPWHNDGFLCFRASAVVSKDKAIGGVHNWIGIYGPSRGDSRQLDATGWKNIDINIDPWPASGAKLTPKHPHMPEQHHGFLF